MERLPVVTPVKRTEAEEKKLGQDRLSTKTPPASTEEKLQRIVGTNSTTTPESSPTPKRSKANIPTYFFNKKSV